MMIFHCHNYPVARAGDASSEGRGMLIAGIDEPVCFGGPAYHYTEAWVGEGTALFQKMPSRRLGSPGAHPGNLRTVRGFWPSACRQRPAAAQCSLQGPALW